MLLPKSVALDTAKEVRLVVLQMKLSPVVRKFIVAVEATPDELIIAGTLASTSQREVHAVHILGSNALGLNENVTFWITVSVVYACGGGWKIYS
jgi:hypothetical protein